MVDLGSTVWVTWVISPALLGVRVRLTIVGVTREACETEAARLFDHACEIVKATRQVVGKPAQWYSGKPQPMWVAEAFASAKADFVKGYCDALNKSGVMVIGLPVTDAAVYPALAELIEQSAGDV
jgi:hypothetical protein